ncbi:MAG: class I SAM-dependent methyltransferase [Desulfobulbaceae bacterium]|uniref:Class I SAM-dependent methyltransferase n=1 Tax=Candidatus Desulfatifera sulfidica TaxID=2841691 RepID=A0A8J6N7K2_9BACT|nr:class I SAM-dependent methyltransferase [Candidatus Desulfatifera sulfidica]
MSNRKEIHDRVLSAASKDELKEAYSDWADAYDHDLLNEMGYVAPTIAVNEFQSHLQGKQIVILDAGCGTGLVGALLSEKGYRIIDGLDYSPQMLEKANEKQVYRDLAQADLTASLDISDNQYDAVISVGTFTCAHVGPVAFNELLRITKPGGYICFTVRDTAWDEDQYHLKMGALEKEGRWKCVKADTANYIEQEGSQCKVCVYQVT